MGQTPWKSRRPAARATSVAVAALLTLPLLPVAAESAGPIAWWRAEGDATDAAGTHDGALRDGATFADGHEGQAFSLAGTAYVEVPDSAELNFAGSFSVDAWVRTVDDTGAIVSKWECGGDCPSFVANSLYSLRVASGRIETRLRDSDASLIQIVSGRQHVADGEFHHLALVRDVEEDQIRLFVDGSLDGWAALGDDADGPLQDDDGAPDALTIGAARSAGSTAIEDHLNGEIDELRLHARALSAHEIRTAAGVASEPIASWRADGDASDSSGYNHGTLRDGATFADGRGGQAFSLANTAYVEIPDSPEFNFPGSFTIDAWIRADAGHGVVLSKYECGGDCPDGSAASAFIVGVTNGTFSGRVRESGATGSGQHVGGDAPVADGEFHHVAFVRDNAAAEMRLYVDGELDAWSALGAAADGPLHDDDGFGDPLTIGAHREGGQTVTGNHFQGLIDELRLHARTLTPEEIRLTAGVQGSEPTDALQDDGGSGGDASDDPAHPTHITFGEGGGNFTGRVLPHVDTIDAYGITLPENAEELCVEIRPPAFLDIRLTLMDPTGAVVGFPDDAGLGGAETACAGANPAAGTWTLVIELLTTPQSGALPELPTLSRGGDYEGSAKCKPRC